MATEQPSKRVRLTHVVVQAHFVVDHDGGKLERKQVDTVELEADQIQAFFDERLPAALAEFEADLNGGGDA
ncbi:hypothetical protein [Pseudoclavibacter sp. 8L]|uniref:hypothetical protein n=1 Tax=Pseudoclavibacter sp. 8L TaxID=2653162 RepID=UPI0012F08B79|nr:hypothetical protein [Pseudoclavibacter sp. 8L]VXB32455.1 conserved hypothetical protein [Pseudoclavibacter sp. 8L]